MEAKADESPQVLRRPAQAHLGSFARLEGASSEGGDRAAVPAALGQLSHDLSDPGVRAPGCCRISRWLCCMASQVRAIDDGLACLNLVTGTWRPPAHCGGGGGGDGAVSGLEPGPGIHPDPC